MQGISKERKRHNERDMSSMDRQIEKHERFERLAKLLKIKTSHEKWWDIPESEQYERIIGRIESLQKASSITTVEEKHILTDDEIQEAIDIGTNRAKSPEYSDWYDYKGNLEFDDELWTEIEFKDPIDKFHTTFEEMACNNQWSRAKRYRIKLDGVRVIEHDWKEKSSKVGLLWSGREIIGHDIFNKIIIIKQSIDKET